MSIEVALSEIDSMITFYDKQLFIKLFGNIINESFIKRLEVNESVDTIFNDLCQALKEKSSLK